MKPGGDLGPRWYCPNSAMPWPHSSSEGTAGGSFCTPRPGAFGRADESATWSRLSGHLVLRRDSPYDLFISCDGLQSFRRSPSGRCCLEAFPVQGEDRGIRVMARPKPERKSKPAVPAGRGVLPAELQVGDHITDETAEWEVIAPPYSTAGGRVVHARVQKINEPASWEIRSWDALKRINVT